MIASSSTPQKRHRSAPQPKPEEEKRKIRVIFKVTSDEDKKLDELSAGIGRSQYIRSKLFDRALPRPKAVIPQINRDTYVELARIGNNLNQQTKALNEITKTGNVPLDNAYLSTLEELKKVIASLRNELIMQPTSEKS